MLTEHTLDVWCENFQGNLSIERIGGAACLQNILEMFGVRIFGKTFKLLFICFLDTICYVKCELYYSRSLSVLTSSLTSYLD